MLSSLFLSGHAPDSPPLATGTHWTLLLFDRYGLPLLLLIAVGWAALRAARWLAPRLDKLIDRHHAFLDALEVELGKHGEILEKVQDTQVRVLVVLEESHRAANRAAVSAQGAATSAQGSALSAQTAAAAAADHLRVH